MDYLTESLFMLLTTKIEEHDRFLPLSRNKMIPSKTLEEMAIALVCQRKSCAVVEGKCLVLLGKHMKNG